MPDLSLCTLDELYNEIEKRLDDCVLLGRRIVDADERLFAYKRWHKGTYESVVFMMRHAEWAMHRDYDQSDREAEPWEEL